MSNEPETVTISKERYEELLKMECIVLALEATGVDNWEGYDIAMDKVRGE